MAEFRLSTGALNDIINGYLKLLEDATKIEVELEAGGRRDLEEDMRRRIIDALNEASGTLADGCQQTIYGLIITK